MKLPCNFESFEGETLGCEAPNGHEAGALAQRALETLPGFLVELACQAYGVLFQLWFVRFECGLQVRSHGVRFGSELSHPLIHDLRVAKRAQFAEEFARDFAHGWPSWVRVYLFHHGCHRAAAADSYTKVVNGVRVRR